MKRIGLLLLLLAGVLISCDEDKVTVIPPDWSEEGSWMNFYTNDPDYYDYSFSYTYSSATTYPLEVTAVKNSGYDSQSFGVIFEKQDDGSKYLALMTVNGYVSLWAQDSSKEWYTIEDWAAPASAVSGYGSENTVRITKSGNDYTIYLNSVSVGTFASDGGTWPELAAGGEAGFIVYVASEGEENFPDTPVSVDFKMTQPITVP